MGKQSTNERNAIEKFLESPNFRKKLNEDQKNFKILSEGDLQACVYYHIRRFLDKQKFSKWHLTNKLSVGKKSDRKKFPDISIVVQSKKGDSIVRPRFFIELKEFYLSLKPKAMKSDLKKLENLVKKNRKELQEAYFICAIVSKKYNSKEIEEMIKEWKEELTPYCIEKGYLFPIVINTVLEPKHTMPDMENFEKKMKKLRKFRD